VRLFRGTSVKQLSLLGLVLAPFAIVLGWQTEAERRISVAYRTLELGMPVTAAQSAFGRPPDCTYTVREHTVRFFVPRGPRQIWGHQERLCRQGARPTILATWADVPRGAHSSACVVVGKDGVVQGLSLVDEEPMRRGPSSSIGLN
jgi:hypothetical protein